MTPPHPPSDLPLAGVRVIDFTQVMMGPVCTQMLADYGADILKIERKGAGDLSRSTFEPVHGADNPIFCSLNRNKRSAALDLRDAGQLAVRAGTTLTLGGTLDTGFAANHRGAEVDIAANKLAVVAHAGTEYGNGSMTLAADTLNQLGAASMVLGGIRKRDENGTNLTVSASDVVLDNAGSVLSAPDLILAATNKVTMAENAAITASNANGKVALEYGQGATDGVINGTLHE